VLGATFSFPPEILHGSREAENASLCMFPVKHSRGDVQ
jgi:hypothetical protein